MNTRLISAVLVLLLALATAAVAHVWRPTRHIADEIGKPNLEVLFPKKIGKWVEDTRMPVVLPAPDVQAKLDALYNQVLSRAYIGPDGARIIFSKACCVVGVNLTPLGSVNVNSHTTIDDTARS